MVYDQTVSYASPEAYLARNGSNSLRDSELVRVMLESVSRVVDRRCQVADGMFATQESVSMDVITFNFDAGGGDTLYLRDNENSQYLLRSIDTDLLEVDGGDGTFGLYACDLTDGWLRGVPANAATFGRPFTAIELLPFVTGSLFSTWPSQKAAVRITGDWGWAATPGAITERVIGITRELVEAHHAGGAMMVSQIEEAIGRVPTARALMAMLEKEFSYRIPSFA